MCNKSGRKKVASSWARSVSCLFQIDPIRGRREWVWDEVRVTHTLYAISLNKIVMCTCENRQQFLTYLLNRNWIRQENIPNHEYSAFYLNLKMLPLNYCFYKSSNEYLWLPIKTITWFFKTNLLTSDQFSPQTKALTNWQQGAQQDQVSWVTSGEQEGQSVAKGGKAVSYVSPHWVPEMNRVSYQCDSHFNSTVFCCSYNFFLPTPGIISC